MWAGAEHTVELGVRPPVTTTTTLTTDSNNLDSTIEWVGAEHTIGLGVRPPVTTTTTTDPSPGHDYDYGSPPPPSVGWC